MHWRIKPEFQTIFRQRNDLIHGVLYHWASLSDNICQVKGYKWTKVNANFQIFPLVYEISYLTHAVQSARPAWALANIVPLWTCNWEGIWLVSIHKWPFATISTSIFGISCAAYVKYASAQSLDFLDLAANCSFINWKLQLAPSGVSAGSYLLLVIRYSLMLRTATAMTYIYK